MMRRPSQFYFGFLLLAIAIFLKGSCWVYASIALLLSITQFYFGYQAWKEISPEGKAVLVTGCDSGFGLALALKLSEIGFLVFATCVNNKSRGAEKLKQNESKGKIHVVKMNVTNEKDVQEVKEYVKHNLNGSKLWAIVNNAGITMSLGFVESKPMDHFETIMSVNVFGMVRVTRAFLPFIRKSQGRIVNVSSTLGRRAVPIMSDYAMSKHCVEAFSDALRLEVKPFGVKVCTIEPGNFMAATSIITQPQFSLRYCWDLMDETAQRDYGRRSLMRWEAYFQSIKQQSNPDISPVVDAMKDAICQVHPKTHYLVAVLSSKILVYVFSFLPGWLSDYCFESLVELAAKKKNTTYSK